LNDMGFPLDRCRSEAVLWCNEKNLSPGLMADSKALLHCIQPTMMTQIQATKGMESQKKVDIETDLEAAVLTSFQGAVPSVLVGGKTDLEGGPFKVLYNYQKSFDKWDPPCQGKGLKARIANGVQAAVQHLETLLKSSGVTREAYTLATGLTHDSAHFLNELASWKTNAYHELISDTAIPKEAVWEMIIECEVKIWEDINNAQAQYLDAAKFNAGYYIWGMLKAGLIQDRYLENNFHDDPALTGIFTRQILFHGQDMSMKSKLQALLDQVSLTTTTAKSNAGEIKATATKLKDLEKDLRSYFGSHP